MVQLSNKREMYQATNETTDLKLLGDITFGGEKQIVNFSGSFTDVKDNYAGNFSYYEQDGSFTKNLTNIPDAINGKANDLLDATVLELKNVQGV